MVKGYYYVQLLLQLQLQSAGDGQLLDSILYFINGDVIDFTLHSNVVHDLTVGIFESCEEKLVPKGTSITFVIEKANRYVFSLRNSSSDYFHCILICQGTL